MVPIRGPLNNDLSVMHGNNTSFMQKCLRAIRQMVHINSPHKVLGLPNLIHGTDEEVNASSSNALALSDGTGLGVALGLGGGWGPSGLSAGMLSSSEGNISRVCSLRKCFKGA